MQDLELLQPQEVFHYFKQIASIPHGSYHTKAISDWCMKFAEEHNLEAYQDEYNNVIIIKEATEGYENSEPVIIQGHLDMVCEKENDCEIDFEKDGLELYVDGDFLRAKGTTLGGDDGIAIAYALALLDSEEIAHPRLECVFTIDEEVGMLGAQSIDLSMLKGKRMLNIDSDVEGEFLTSCAGGASVLCKLPVAREKVSGHLCTLQVTGLQGGHSGSEIDKERANAIALIGRVLYEISKNHEIHVIDIVGGLKDNAIPRETICRFVTKAEAVEGLIADIKQLQKILHKEYAMTDGKIILNFEVQEEQKADVMDAVTQKNCLFWLHNFPNGIMHMMTSGPKIVETSLNAGILKTSEDMLSVSLSVRSSVQSRREALIDKIQHITEYAGGSVEVSGKYPAWEYEPVSELRILAKNVYEGLYQKEAKIMAIHAGLECGMFSGKIKGLDCISFGPTNYDIHTPQERLSISSAERVWKFIIEMLKRMK